MYCISCGEQNHGDAKFCAKCGEQIAGVSEGAADKRTATSSRRPFDPQLAAYDVLRRLVCRRSPLVGLSSEHNSIPDDLKSEVEFGCLVHQVSVYLDLAQRNSGHVVSERVRTHLLLLAGFDPKLEAGLMRFPESIRAADAEFKAGRFSDLFEGPSADLTRYYSTPLQRFWC